MPEFRWFIGGRELETTGRRMEVVEDEVIMDEYNPGHPQLLNELDGSTSTTTEPSQSLVGSPSATATLRFIPQPEDHGKYLACRATNEYFPGRPKEDGYILNVRCE